MDHHTSQSGQLRIMDLAVDNPVEQTPIIQNASAHAATRSGSRCCVEQHVASGAADFLMAAEQALALVSAASATWMELLFHGSMYSSTRYRAGMVQANVVSAVSALLAMPRPRCAAETV